MSMSVFPFPYYFFHIALLNQGEFCGLMVVTLFGNVNLQSSSIFEVTSSA